MRRSEVGSAKADPAHVIPCFGQVGHDDSESGSKETWHVLHEHDSRSKYANESRELVPEPGAGAESKPSTSAGVRDILTGESSCEDIYLPEREQFAAELVHVRADRHLGEAPREHRTTRLIRLAGIDDLRARPLETEVEPATAREERDDTKAHASTSSAGRKVTVQPA